MKQVKIRLSGETNKNLALYQLQRDFKNRGEAIDDAVSKAIKYEQLTSPTNETDKI